MCVHEQNYTLVIVTQQKNSNVKSIQIGRPSFNLSLKMTQQPLSDFDQVWITKRLDKC